MTDTAHDSPTSLAEARDRIEGFGKHFDYDVGYMLLLADTAPAAFAAFDSAMALSAPRPALPPEVRAVAVFATLRTDDCGACAQLNLRMAVEAGVPRPLLQTLLDEPEVLPAPLDDAYAHARQVAGGGEADPARIERLRAALGDEGLGELAVAIVGARLYPTLKRALGTATSCRRPTLDF